MPAAAASAVFAFWGAKRGNKKARSGDLAGDWGGAGLGLLGLVAFFPRALGRLGDQTLLEGGGGDADVADFAAGQLGFDALEVHPKLAFGDRGDVRTDTTRLLGFTRAPDNAALHRAFAGQFTNACHKLFFR